MTLSCKKEIEFIDLHSASILIVDDEPANIKLMRDLLSAEGYKNVYYTSDPKESIALYAEVEPDILLLDLNMPEMDGYQVMSALFSQYGSALSPVLVLTAQSSREFKIRAFDSCARDFITKPFDLREVLARLRNLLETKLLHDHLAVQNRQLEEKVEERTREIQNTRLEIIRRLGRAAEYRDNETGLHIVRMSKMCELLGSACGLNDEMANLLLNASPMHDVGKIGISDSILLKPGKLDENEWETMKTHTTIGANILSGDDSDLMIMAKEIAISHHEKWDGSGYPDGLAGDEIPLVGRIAAVADVFDALTSSRPYKKAWPLEEAIDFMNQQTERHFDPEIIKQFNTHLPEILAVSENYSEPEE